MGIQEGGWVCKGTVIQEGGWVYWGTGIQEGVDRYHRGKMSILRRAGIQEEGDGVGRHPRGRGIQEGTLGALYPRGVAGLQ